MDLLNIWPAILCVLVTCAIFVFSLVMLLLSEFSKGKGDKIKQKQVEIPAQPPKSSSRRRVLRNETWEAWGGALHPGWLIGLRLFAFCYMATLFLAAFLNQPNLFDIFFYYTEWTLSIFILYFGWGAALGIWHVYGSLRNQRGAGVPDAESGELQSILLQKDRDQEEIAGFCGQIFQVLYQVAAPAVVLTDMVYWIFLYPMFPLNFSHTFTEYNIHGGNFIFLAAEILLNSMMFPWIGLTYFFIWSCSFVFFQFLIHFTGWYQGSMPYPFMDVSTPYSPLWYVALGAVHAFAYSIVVFMNKLKLYLQSRTNQ